MRVDVNIDASKLHSHLEDVMEIAAVKAWETAVERTPAAKEGPYSTGQMRQSLRYQKTGDLEYTIVCQVPYGIYNEFGTGPKGQATGGVLPNDEKFPNDPYDTMQYHSGEVLVTRSRGKLLDTPYVRHTQGMQAQPFMRPALLAGVEWIRRLLEQK